MACESPCQLSSDKPYDSSNDLSSWSEPLAIKPPPEFQDSSPYSSTPQDSPLMSPQVTLGRSVRPHATAIAPARLTPARLHPGVPKWLEKMAVKMVTQVSIFLFRRLLYLPLLFLFHLKIKQKTFFLTGFRGSTTGV